MEEETKKAHAEGATSATDTLTGTSMAALALIGVRLFLGGKGVTLTEGELLAVGGAMTGLFTAISSYVHGFFRGKRR